MVTYDIVEILINYYDCDFASSSLRHRFHVFILPELLMSSQNVVPSERFEYPRVRVAVRASLNVAFVCYFKH